MAFQIKTTSVQKQTNYFYEGRMIVLTKQPGRPRKRTKLTHATRNLHRGDWWPQDKKIEAATVFAVTRNYDRTSDLTGIPAHELRKFGEEAWWHEIGSKVRKEKNEALDGKITETLDKALDLITDRLVNGETYYNPRTETEYILPVKAKDAAIVTSILFEKRQLIRGEATSRTENSTSEQKLLVLKANFEKLAKSKLINPDSEPIDVLYEENNVLEVKQEEIPPLEENPDAVQ